MRINLDELPEDSKERESFIRELVAFCKELQAENLKLARALARVNRAYFGRRSEQLDADQMRFAVEGGTGTDDASQAEPPAEDPSPPPVQAKKKGHGRQNLPPHLERQIDQHELPEDRRACPCCGRTLELMGYEASEQLDIRPARFFVRRILRGKYSCAGCHGALVTAAGPWVPIERGLPGFALLAHIIVSKFQDHLPLYRLQTMAAREGVALARSTMVGWLAAAAQLLAPLVAFMATAVLQSRKIHTDDTPVRMLDPGAGKCATTRLWPYIGDEDHPFVVFDFTLNRKRVGPVSFLKGFKGHLQVDAFAGYDELFKSPDVIEVACMAHARRKIFEARDTSVAVADVGLDLIRQLYAIERSAKGLPEEKILAMRREESVPLLEKLHAWLRIQQKAFLPKEPMGMAVGYALNNWAALRRYADTGFLNIDNNPAENAVRPVALGRKNYLFIGSPAGGRRAAIFYSLLSTCKRHGVNPTAYLTDVLERVWTHPASRIEELLPHDWQAARAAPVAAATA